MTENVMASDWCFGVPIDHRLIKALVVLSASKSSKTGLGSHLATLERHGHGISRPKSRSPTTSESEIKFGRWLAPPIRQGGLVVALLQPAPNQQYTPNVERTSKMNVQHSTGLTISYRSSAAQLWKKPVALTLFLSAWKRLRMEAVLWRCDTHTRSSCE